MLVIIPIETKLLNIGSMFLRTSFNDQLSRYSRPTNLIQQIKLHCKVEIEQQSTTAQDLLSAHFLAVTNNG